MSLKLKRLPEDFQVEEITKFSCSEGPYATYLLTKTSLGTLEAVQAIAAHWKLDQQQVAFGGLKDKHARTIQYVTIEHGPKQDHEERSFRLQYVGQAERPFHAQDISANRFRIALRRIHPSKRGELRQAAELASQGGIPNYFDDQRFGSLGASGDFIAHAWCLGDYERALWLAIAEHNSHDRGREADQKALLRERWGYWPELERRLDRSDRKRVAAFLTDYPGDYRRALTLLRHDLRSLWLAAFQSHLWNEMLTQLIIDQVGGEQVIAVEGAAGNLAFPKTANLKNWQALREVNIPLPSARSHDLSPKFESYLDNALQPLEMSRHQLRLKYPRDTFFSKGDRAALFGVEKLQIDFEEDELEPGFEKAILQFELGRGSYATMLVRWLEMHSASPTN